MKYINILFRDMLLWSPDDFNDGNANVFDVEDGTVNNDFSVNYPDGAVRPALSLSTTAITGGSGTTTDPFTVG